MRCLFVALVFLTSLAACAQPGSGPLSPNALQIATAVAPLPEEFRATASVRALRDGGLVSLRDGDGPFICLANNPANARFHVACYHKSLEPFMARGRELRVQGHTTDVDEIRNAEVEAGTLAMPTHPAALYSLSGTDVSINDTTGVVSGASPLYVVYIAHATAESTGLPTTPMPNSPWLMFPGTPKAHIMFVPEM